MTTAPLLAPLLGTTSPAVVNTTPGMPVRASAGAQAAAVVAPTADIPAVKDPETAVAMTELADVLRTTSIGLRFEIDDVTHEVVTKVIDKETGELIRQIPSEEVLRFARALDKLQGVFISQLA